MAGSSPFPVSTCMSLRLVEDLASIKDFKQLHDKVRPHMKH